MSTLSLHLQRKPYASGLSEIYYTDALTLPNSEPEADNRRNPQLDLRAIICFLGQGFRTGLRREAFRFTEASREPLTQVCQIAVVLICEVLLRAPGPETDVYSLVRLARGRFPPYTI